jgi:hypothetical protein
MNELPPAAREAFHEARRSFTPSAARLEQIHARVLVAAAMGKVPEVSHELPRGMRSGAPALRWLVPWGLAGLTLVLGALSLQAFSPRPPSSSATQGVSPGSEAAAAEPAADRGSARADAERPADAAARKAGANTSAARAGAAGVDAASTRPARAASARTATAAGRTSADASDKVESSTSSAAPTSSAPKTPDLDTVAGALDIAPTSSGSHAAAPPRRVPGTKPRERRAARSPALTRDASSASSGAPSKAGAALAREVELIGEARRALEAGRPVDAEQLLARHIREFPAGQLRAERLALEARARCALGDGEAARKLDAQLALVAPRSSLGRTVERACAALWSR